MHKGNGCQYRYAMLFVCMETSCKNVFTANTFVVVARSCNLPGLSLMLLSRAIKKQKGTLKQEAIIHLLNPASPPVQKHSSLLQLDQPYLMFLAWLTLPACLILLVRECELDISFLEGIGIHLRLVISVGYGSR